MAGEALTIEVRNVRDVVVLDLAGRLIMGGGEKALRDTARRLVDGGNKNLAMNMSNVTYIDSSGVGALASAWTSASRIQAKCKLFAVPGKIRLMLKISRLDTVLEIFADEASALASF